jgi:hypothetical protein
VTWRTSARMGSDDDVIESMVAAAQAGSDDAVT